MIRRTVSLAILLVVTLAAGCTPADVRIDGSSLPAFKRTHDAMVASLAPTDRLKLEAAELILRAAASPERPDGYYSPSVSLTALRTELDGKSFKDIWQLASTKDIKIKVGFVTQP